MSAEVLLSKGKMIDKYQIVKLIGFGGMGAVYLAIDTDNEYDNAYVALKILYPKLARKSGDFTRRFLREARIASRIKHPNLVQVFECNFSDENGFYYLAQEFVGGGSLRQLVSNDTVLSEIEALRVAIGVTQALVAVHEHKVVHRDIKPDNIMFTAEGTVKLTDWGIAKQRNFSNAAALAQLELTVNKVFMGTPLYASPEQLQDSRNVDIRSDIYSLGATIYYSLVGKPPFRGTTEVDSLCAVLNRPAPDVRKARPDISDKLAVLLLRMLAKSPDERPAHPGVLLELLLDAGQKYHLREHLGISGIHSSGVAKESGHGKPVFGSSPVPYQPTEATRRPEPCLAPEVVLQPDAGSKPASQREAMPADEPVEPSEYCPEAGLAGDSKEDFSSVTGGTLIAEKQVGQADRSSETRSGKVDKSAVSRTVSVDEGEKALPSARAPSRVVAWMIRFILLLAVVFFAAEQWVQIKSPGVIFARCMAMGEVALRNHAWQDALFYYRGASHVPGYENDRRPDAGIAIAKRGLDFEQKMASALQVLKAEVQKSKIDWKEAHTLFSEAMAIEGFQQNVLILQKVDYCKRGMQYTAFFRSGVKAADSKQWQSAVENFVKALRVPGFEKDCEAQELLQTAQNNLHFLELFTQGQQACQAAVKSGTVADWQKALDDLKAALSIPGVSKEDLAGAEKALLSAKAGLQQAQKNYLDDLFTQVETAMEKADYSQAKKCLKSILDIPFLSAEDRNRAKKLAAEIEESERESILSTQFRELFEAGKTAIAGKNYRLAEQKFLEALKIQGYEKDATVMALLSEVWTAWFKVLIERAKNPTTPVDQAINDLNEAEKIQGITPVQRLEVAKTREDIRRTEEERRKAELQRKYDSLLAEAEKLLADAKSMADYEEVEKRYQEAKQMKVADRTAAEVGLQECYRQRNEFLFKAGDEFADRKKWADAMDCYQKILFGVFSDSGDRKKAEGKILACRLSELRQLLEKGQEALRREDWQVAEDDFRRAAEKARGDFPKEKAQALAGQQSALNGLDFQRHFGEGRSLLKQHQYWEAVKAFEKALKVPGFEKHPEALKNRQEAHLLADEEQKTVERNRFEQLIAEAGPLLQDGQFAASEMKYTEAGKVPGYAQDQRVKEGLDKIKNSLRFQGLKSDLDGTMQRADWHEAEKLLVQLLSLPGYQNDLELKMQLTYVRGRIFQNFEEQGKKFFNAENWEKAAEEFQKALAVEGYQQHPEVQKLLDQALGMTRWLEEMQKAEKDFRKTRVRLQEEKYFRTGALKNDYLCELKNIWAVLGDCPVERISKKGQEELWEKEIQPDLTQASDALLNDLQVLSLTGELQAHTRREFLALLAEVDVICEGKISSLDEKSELRINVTRFFLVDYFHPDLIKDTENLPEDPRRIVWLAKLFR